MTKMIFLVIFIIQNLELWSISYPIEVNVTWSFVGNYLRTILGFFYKRDILVLFSIVQWAVARKYSSLVMRRWNGDETKCSRDMVVDGWVCSSRVCRNFGESRLVVGGGGGVRCTCEINCEHEDM